MNRYFRICLAVCVTFVLLFALSAHADEKKEKQASAAAKKWLDLVDKGKYAESWDTAASMFKSSVTKDAWEQSVGAVRKNLGPVKKRKLGIIQYTKTLPGAPDGEYVVIQYESTFENKQSAEETVTPMLDKDGKWRVSGYYIK